MSEVVPLDGPRPTGNYHRAGPGSELRVRHTVEEFVGSGYSNPLVLELGLAD